MPDLDKIGHCLRGVSEGKYSMLEGRKSMGEQKKSEKLGK